MLFSCILFDINELFQIPIPCRPQKTFSVLVYEIPEDIPDEDIRHSLFKFQTVVEVVRLYHTGNHCNFVNYFNSNVFNIMK